jgi:hypothetical protein
MREIHYIKRGCLKVSRALKFTIEDIKHYVEVESNSGYKLLSNEFKPKTQIEIKCNNNHTYFCYFDNFKNKNSRCQKCNGTARFTFDEVKYYIEVESKSNYKLVSNKYKNNKTPLLIECDNGHIYPTDFRRFKNHGFRCNDCHLKSVSVKMTGAPRESHPSFKKELTEEHRLYKRLVPNYKEWIRTVLKRDKFTCQCCKKYNSGKLNAHHLDGYHWCIEKRTDVDNGVTLCEQCHLQFHMQYGFKENKKEQFYEYLLQYEIANNQT